MTTILPSADSSRSEASDSYVVELPADEPYSKGLNGTDFLAHWSDRAKRWSDVEVVLSAVDANVMADWLEALQQAEGAP